MRRFLFSTGAVILVCLSVLVAKEKLSSADDLNIAEKCESVSHERSFVIAVASYNNDKYYERNLDSIFSQEYKNYRVIYTDDCSTDNTYENVKRYVENKKVQDKITLIHNSLRSTAMPNYYKMIHSCKNDEIVLIVDGDDWLPHPHVLRDLNHYYENPDVWMTYGQYIRYPDDQLGMCAPVSKTFLKNAKMRSGKWQYAHLRTFYAGLFNRIKLEDLLIDGKFFEVTCDLAAMYPMLEMAREHAYFIPDVFYVYNYETPLTDAKVRLAEQERVERYIRSLPIYEKLEVHPATPFPESKCDLIAFSYNRPMQLYSFLESLEKNVKGLTKTMIIYRTDPDFSASYEIVKGAFPQVAFYKQSDTRPKEEFKSLVMQLLLEESKSDYIVFGVDDNIFTDSIDLQFGMRKLQETGSYGFYYRFGRGIDYSYTMDMPQGVPDLMDIGNDTLAWKFEKGKIDWDYPNSVDFVLYRKEDIKDAIEKIAFTSPNYLEGEWANHADHHKIGLCHSKPRLINVPANNVSQFGNRHGNITTEQLNQMFLQGLKIDISPLHKHEGHSAHEEIDFTFVAR